jgi:hypothetical protein
MFEAHRPYVWPDSRVLASFDPTTLHVAEDRLSLFLIGRGDQGTKAFSSSVPCLLIGSKARVTRVSVQKSV